MTRIINHYLIKSFYIAVDFFVIYLAVFLASWIRQGTLGFPVTWDGILFSQDNPFRYLFALWILSAVSCANANRLYQTRREVFKGVEILLVLKCVVIATLILIVTIYVLKIEGFPRTIVAITSGFMFVFMSLWRMAKRMVVDYIVAHGYNNFNVLVIGAGKIGSALAWEIKKQPSLGLRVAGFLDDFKTEMKSEDSPKILGRITDFVPVARREFIHQVFITIHHDSKAFLSLLDQARELGVSVRVIPEGFSHIEGELVRFNIGFIPVLEYTGLIDTRRQLGKRLFDFVMSLAALIVLFPVFLVIALIIKADSPGPVFYKSRRYSRRGRIFSMLKFRSMVDEADKRLKDLRNLNETDGPIFKMKKDPRVTRIGSFLRRYSLDELPQLINVLHGEMSLVGPRPLPIEQIEKHDLRQFKRLEVRPGITGLWQIRGRSDVSFFRLIRWDIWYINNWSFFLDLYILLQTVPVVIKGKGAY